MKESDRSEAGGSGLDSGPLPEVLERLCDAMHGLDPDWNLEVWLIKKAEEEIELLKMDLERERIKLEQKIHRVDSIANRLEPEIEIFEANQTNLFDCFDITAVNTKGPLVPASIQDEDQIDHPHPAKNLLDYLFIYNFYFSRLQLKPYNPYHYVFLKKIFFCVFSFFNHS